MALSTISAKNVALGGIKCGNFDKIVNQFICEICKLILLNPYQLLCCGRLLCEWCFKKGLSNSEPFTCQFCFMEKAKKEGVADRGVSREMKKIIIVCYLCAWTGSYQDYLNHLQEFHANIECSDCHEHFFAINLYEEHREELCLHRYLSCELPDCLDSVKWYDMKTHYLSDKHQQILASLISEYINQNNQQLQNEKYFEILRIEFNDIHECIDTSRSSCEILSNDISRLKLDQNQIKTILDQIIPNIDELKKQDNENEKNSKELLTNQNNLQIELDTMKTFQTENQFLILDNNSSTILRFDYPNRPSFSINSSKCKTSLYGYTFMLRLCSTIESQKSYLSIFLTLLNGEYDNLIPYPFSYNIYFTLLDQSNQDRHIEYVLKPDLNSPSFSRPVRDRNDEYGIMKFCLLEYITDKQSIYVKDGVFFIRIFINFLNNEHDPFQSKKIDIISTTE